MGHKENSKQKLTRLFILATLLFSVEELKASGIKVDNVSEGFKPTITTSRTNIDQVDIVTPNSKGISHNKFSDYNVKESGVILNNSKIDINTQLGGIINGNKNLTDREASLIITEVIGRNASNINGFTEIAGKKADYILANPNGINVNGAGFINARNVTLSTGEVLDNLNLQIRKGLITVGDKGINTDGVDYFNLISKTAKISGQINSNKKDTKEIKVITGSNDYDYNSKTLKSIEDNENKGLVGIDTSDLGGMIANKITLISTDKGVGVNTKGVLIAEEDNIDITSDGDIVVKNIKSAKEIKLKAQEKASVSNDGIVIADNINVSGKNIEVEGALYGKNKVNLETAILETGVNGEIISEENIGLKKVNEIKNKGKIKSEKNIETDANIINSGHIVAKKIDFEKDLKNSGKVVGDVVNISGENLENTSLIYGEQALSLKSKNIKNDKMGVIWGEKEIKIENEEVNNFGKIQSKDKLSINGNKLVNNGTIYSTVVDVKSTNVENKKGANLLAKENLTIAESLSNEGTIFGNESIEIGKKLTNSGRVASNNINLKEVENAGEIEGQNIKIESTAFSNKEKGKVKANDLNVKANTLTNSGELVGVNKLEISSDKKVENKGKLLSNKKITLNSEEVVNSGEVASNEEVVINGTTLENSGKIESKKITTKENSLRNINNGKIKGNTVNITSDEIENEGELTGVEHLEISSNKILVNKGKVLSNKTFALNSDKITNQGEIANNEELAIKGKNLENSGKIEAKRISVETTVVSNEEKGSLRADNLGVKAEKIENKGELIGVDGIEVTLNNSLNNAGKVLSNKNITLNSESVVNSGEIGSRETVKIKGKNLQNKGTVKSQTLDINAQDIKNDGNLLATKDINIADNKAFNNTGKVYSKGNINIKSDVVTNEEDIVAHEDITLNANSIKVSNGEVFSKNLKIDTNGHDITLTDNIHSVEKLDVNAKNIDLKDNYQNVGDINLKATESIKVKNLLSESNINLESGALEANGEIKFVSAKNTKIKTKNDLDIKGEIKSYGGIDISTEGYISNDGKIVARENLKIKGKNITNKGERTLYSGKDMELVSDTNITNEAGAAILALEGNLKLEAKDQILNESSKEKGATIKAGGNIDITAKSLKNDATKFADAIINKGYTEKEIKEIVKLKNSMPILKKNFKLGGSAGALGGENVRIYSIENWEQLGYKDFYGENSNFNVKNEHHNTDEGNYKVYTLNSKVNIESSKENIGARLKQGTIQSAKNINIKTENKIENRGIINATKNIDLNSKDIKNISEVEDLGDRVTSFETNIKAKIKREYMSSLFDGILGLFMTVTPEPVYTEIDKEPKEIKTEKVLLPAQQLALITAGEKVTIKSEDIKNVDAINYRTDNNKIKKEDYDKFIKNKNNKFERENEIEVLLTESSNKKFIKRLDKLQNEALNIEENGNVNEHKNNEVSRENVSNINLEKDVVKDKILNDSELKKIQDRVSTEKFVDIYNGTSGLFKISENTNKPLIQTNIEFIDLNKYYASDYFFKKIGYKPEAKVRQLGDSYYETSLINKVVVATFGNKLKETDKDEATVMKGLLDNAVEESKKNKNLKVGKALSNEDINNLDKNIVWYVEKEINGEKVLAPQLYVAKTGTKGFVTSGSQISGKDVNIRGAEIINNGNISADNRLDIDAISLVNISGASKAKIEAKDSFITAIKDVENIGAEINAKGINYIKSTDGNIINESTKKKIATLDGEFYKEKIDNIAKITAGDRVVLEAKELSQTGSEIKGKDVNIFAKDINVNSLELNEKDKITGGYLTKIKGTDQTIGTSYEANVSRKTNVSSKITGENNVRLEGNNLAVKGSDIKGNNILIDADKIDIQGTKDVLDSEYSSRINTSFYVEKEKEKAHIEEINKTKLEAGDNLVISSYGNISLSGVDRKSGGLTTINSRYGNVEEKAEKVNNQIERNSYKLGMSAELDENDVAKNNAQKLNAKLGFEANPGNETEADNLLNKGFVTQQNLSKYGASGSVTLGFTQRTVDEKINEEKYVQNNIEAKNQKVQANYNIVRKGFKEDIKENSNIESKNGDIRIEATKNKRETSKKESAFSIGTEYGYRVPVLTIAENIGKRAEYEKESQGSVLNAVNNNKESVGVAGDVALRALETLGDLSKLNSGTDLVTVYSKSGITYSTVDKNSVVTEENRNESKVGNTSSFIAKNNVAMSNVEIDTKNLNVQGENFILKSGTKTEDRRENGYSNTLDLEGNMGVDIDGGNVGAQINLDSSTVVMDSRKTDNVLSKINVQDSFVLNTNKDAKIEGKITAKDFKGNIGNKLEVVSLQDSKKENSTNINANISAGAVMSTNGISPTANIGVTTGVGKERKNWTQEQSGIVATDKFDLNVKDTIELKGAILGSLKEGNTNIKAKELLATDLEDSHVKAGGYVGGGFGVGKKGISTVNVKVGTSEGFVKNQTTKSTVGTGNVEVGNDISNLNRDLNKTQEKTKDFVISKYDLDFSIHKKNKAQKNAEEEIKQKNKVEEEHIYEEIKDVIPTNKAKVTQEEHIYEEIQDNGIYSKASAPIYSKVGEKVEVENPIYGSKAPVKEEHIYEEIQDNGIYSKAGAPIYSKVGDKVEVENPIYGSKAPVKEEHIYEEIQDNGIYSKAGAPIYSKVGEKVEVENPIYGSKASSKEEPIYAEIEEITTNKVNTSSEDKIKVEEEKIATEKDYPLASFMKNNSNNNDGDKNEGATGSDETPRPRTVMDRVRGFMSKFTTKTLKEEPKVETQEVKVQEEAQEPKVEIEKNIATKHKVDRITSELEELNNSKQELDAKFNQFISTNKKLAKMQKQVENIEGKISKLEENSKNLKKIEKLQAELEVRKTQLNDEVKKVNSTLMDKYEDINSKKTELNSKLEDLNKENLVLLKSEVELSEANHEVLKSPQVFDELKKQYKSKFGIDIEAQGVKPEETSVVKLEKKALNKMVYEVTPSEREAILDKIKGVPKVKSEDISKDIADSVILSSKTLSKNKDLQDKVQSVVEEFLKSGDILTIESLAKLNKEIRVEEAEDNKQIFKTDHLTKEGAVFTDPIVSKQYLENFVNWYNKTSETNELDGLEKAALAYQRLMTYHPFAEGNGRITRVIVNKILLENGYTTLPKFSDELTKKVLPQSSERKGEESYTAREFVDSFIDEIKANTKVTQPEIQEAKVVVTQEEKIEAKVDIPKADNLVNKVVEEPKEVIKEVNVEKVKPVEEVVTEVLAENINNNNNGEKNTNNIGEITPMKEEYKKLFQEAKEKYRNRVSNEEALKKLDTLAKNVKSIPKEHLVKAMEELNFGLKMEDLSTLQKEGKNTNRRVIKPDTLEELDSKGQKNIAKLYNHLEFDKKYVNVRDEINNTIFNKLVENPEFNSLMNSKLSGDKEKIEKLFNIVEQAKHDSLKEVTGIVGERATVKIDEKATSFKLGQGFYDEKKSEVNMNVVPLGAFLRTTQSNNREILDTIIHELTHHDQNQFVKNKAKNKIQNEKIANDVATDVSIFTMNQLHYVQGKVGNIKSYKNQPLEREAFSSGKELSKRLTQYLKEQEKNKK